MRTTEFLRNCRNYIASLMLSFVALAPTASAGAPSAFGHVTDGEFTVFPDGTVEWSDITPAFFPLSDAYLYGDQADLDPLLGTGDDDFDTFMLLYDECGRTEPLGPDEYVLVSFKTVDVVDGIEKLENYVLHIFADGTIIFIENGITETDSLGNARVVEIEGQRGKVGFGPSPTCSTPHVFAEFEIKLSSTGIELNGGYSPDPIFWSSSVPPPDPTPPPPPPPLPDVKGLAGDAAATGGVVAAGFGATAVACALAPELLVTKACAAAAGVTAGLFGLASAIAAKIANDPPDSNFTEIAIPSPPPFDSVIADADISLSLADAWNALLGNISTSTGLGRAFLTSLERRQGAELAGDNFWASQQTDAARQFAVDYGQSLQLYLPLAQQLQAQLALSGFSSISFTAAQMQSTLDEIAISGLSSDLLNALIVSGASAQEITLITDLLLGVTATSGSFPDILTEPSLISAFQDISDGLLESSLLPSGVLFGTDASGGNLLTIDVSDGSSAVIGFIGVSPTPALAIDPVTGDIFAGTGAGTPLLYTVDRVTGAGSLVGNTGLGFAAIGGMDFGPDGILYAAVNLAGDGGTGSDHLATINKTTGLATVIGPFGSCSGVKIPTSGAGFCSLEGMEALAFDASGVLWGALSQRGAAGAPGLYTIDITTGAATFFAPILDNSGIPPSGGVVSLEFCGGTLFGGTARAISPASDGGRLITINKSSGIFTFNGPVSATSGSSLGGLACGGTDLESPPNDVDGDGVPDELDNCPDFANADQLDSDFNGIGDACETRETEHGTAAFLQAQPGGNTFVEVTPVALLDEPPLLEQLARIVEFRIASGLTDSPTQLTGNLVGSLVALDLIPAEEALSVIQAVVELACDTCPIPIEGPIGHAWCDQMETYLPGSNGAPAWHGSGNSGATVIDNTTANHGTNSMKLFGVIGGCSAGIAYRRLELSYPFAVELAAKNGTEDISGCSAFRGAMEFKTVPDLTAPEVTGGFVFLPNGDFVPDVGGFGAPISGFALNKWHVVRGEFSTPGDDSLHVKYWVDDSFVGEFTTPEPPQTPLYLGIAAREGTAWFDDVCVTPDTFSVHAAFAGMDAMPGNCANVIDVDSRNISADTWQDTEKFDILGRKNPLEGRRETIIVAIAGSAELDVTQIALSAVRLQGALPISAPVIKDVSGTGACDGSGADGILDAVFVYDLQRVLKTFGNYSDGSELTLSLVGQLTDGQPFEATDKITIRIKRQSENVNPSASFSLGANYPNPFNPTTKITFALSKSSHVTVEVFNVMGQRVKTLADAEFGVGQHSVIWESVDDNGSPVASGMYFYRMKAGEYVQTRKMLLLN